MKNLCLLLLLLLLASCRENIFSRPDIIVQGKLHNSYTDKMFITSQNLFFKYSLPSIIDTIYIGKDSVFKFYSSAKEDDVFATLNFRKYNYSLPIYMSKGDSVYLDLDLALGKIINIGGEGYKKIFFRDSLYNISERLRIFEDNMMSIDFNCNPIFMQSQKSIELFVKDYFAEFRESHSSLKEDWARHFDLLFDICSFKSDYSDSNFNRLVKKYNIKGAIYKNDRAFFHFANLMTEYFLNTVGTDTTETGAEKYDAVIDSIMSKTIYSFRDICIVSLFEKIIPREWSYTDELYIFGKRKTITPEMHETGYRDYLIDLIDKHFKFQPGNAFPEFLLQDNKTYQYNLFRFKGNKLVIMFRDAGEKDLTALRQLHENFPPNDSIAAISISLGNDNKKLWTSLIENYKIAGTNLYEPNGFYSELADKLLIRDLPIYFLIDEEGNIEIPGTSDLDEIRKKTLAN